MIDPAYFDSLKKRIDSIDACPQLQAISDEISKVMQELYDGIKAEMQTLEPLTHLVISPGSIGNIPALVTDMINYLNNLRNMFTKPYIEFTVQLAQIVSEVAELSTAIGNVAARIKNCNVTPPHINL